MARFTKEELLQKAAPYFSQGEKVMHATEDGNFFYDSHKHHAKNHSTTSGTKIHSLTIEDFNKIGKVEEIIDEEIIDEENQQETDVKKRGRKPNN